MTYRGVRMEPRIKPTVIQLREHQLLHRGISEDETFFADAELSFAAVVPLGMEDAEMTDLKWLIEDFDLRTVCLYDIDAGQEVFRRKKQPIRKRRGRSGPKCRDVLPTSSKRFHPAYHEMIARCLKGAGQVPVRDIYTWIAERFPELTHLDATWKNKVRYTLTTNPLFKKKKSDFGKCNVWFMDNCSNTKSLPPLYPKNFVFSNNPKTKNSVSKKEIQIKPRKLILSDEENVRDPPTEAGASVIDVQQSTEIDFVTQCWFPMEMGMYDSEVVNIATGNSEVPKIESVEYYELEIPIVAEYLIENDSYQDPMGVKYLLEENSESMSLEI